VHKWFKDLCVLNGINLEVKAGEVLKVMKGLALSGMTMMVATHETGFAREVANRVVFIDHGQVLEEAPPDDFFLRPQHERAQQFLKQLLSPMHQ
jgi:polar amino acid transport system ATP-binding protein